MDESGLGRSNQDRALATSALRKVGRPLRIMRIGAQALFRACRSTGDHKDRSPVYLTSPSVIDTRRQISRLLATRQICRLIGTTMQDFWGKPCKRRLTSCETAQCRKMAKR